MAVLMVAYAAATRTLLPDYLSARHPMLVFYPFLFVAALYGGLFSGLLATFLATIAALWWINPPEQRVAVDFWSLTAFILFSAAVSFAGEIRHRARERGRSRKKIRILLVDDHTMIRQGLANLLKAEPDLELAGEAASGESAINLARQVQPDVVLMDICMPGMDGIQATRLIHNEMPGVRVIGLSMLEEADRVDALRKAGAVYYLPKTGSPDHVVSAIRAYA